MLFTWLYAIDSSRGFLGLIMALIEFFWRKIWGRGWRLESLGGGGRKFQMIYMGVGRGTKEGAHDFYIYGSLKTIRPTEGGITKVPPW